MNRLNRFATRVALALALALSFGVAPAAGQDFNFKLKTTLDVAREGEWGNSLTIHKPGPVTFRWATKEAGVAKGIWQIGLINLGVSTSHPPSAIYRQGNAGSAPAESRHTKFTINFQDVVAPNPPATPKKYYVRVVPLDANGQVVGVPSASMVITYAKEQTSLTLGEVHPYGTFADVYVKATANVRATGEAGTKAPDAGGVFKPADVASTGEPVYGDNYMPANRVRFAGLRPNTTYYFVVRGVDKQGNAARVGGSFKTLRRKVTVTFEELHVVDDSDDVGKGEVAVGFYFNNAPDYSLVFTGEADTGQKIPLKGFSVDMADPPNPLAVLVRGVDDDELGVVPAGHVVLYLLNECGGYIVGKPCGDSAEASVTLPFDATGPDEAGDGPFTITAHGGRLKFSVKGRVAVTYVP